MSKASLETIGRSRSPGRGTPAPGAVGCAAGRLALGKASKLARLRASAVGLKREALSFGLVGLFNTFLSLALIWAAMAAGASPLAANAVGYAAGLAVSYALNRRYTFRCEAPAARSLPRFLAVAALAWAVNAAALQAWLAAGAGAFWAQPLAMPFFTVTFFALSKLWAFAPPAAAPASGEAR